MFGVTESRLHDYIGDETLEIPEYTLTRKDSIKSGHTGIAVYVHDVLKHITLRRNDLESDSIENIWFELKLSKCPILVEFIYRNPSINKCPSEVSIWNDDFINMMDKIEHLSLIHI